jgi:hypothetical protein
LETAFYVNFYGIFRQENSGIFMSSSWQPWLARKIASDAHIAEMRSQVKRTTVKLERLDFLNENDFF